MGRIEGSIPIPIPLRSDQPTTRRLTTLLILITGCSSWAQPLAGQIREPEVDRYRFVSDTTGGGLWVNPGAAGFNQRTILIGHYTWNRPRDEGWTTGQYMVGLLSGVLGFGYRHDEFAGEGPFANGDAYTFSAGYAGESAGLGISRTWRSVGPSEGSWELGALLKASERVTLGVVWRDIGSPEVRDTTRVSRLIGALTLAPPPRRFSVSAQADYRTGGGGFRAFRIGGTAIVLNAVDALAAAEWDGDGDFAGLLVGVQIRQPSGLGVGVIGLDSGGDARAVSAGLLATVGQRR